MNVDKAIAIGTWRSEKGGRLSIEEDFTKLQGHWKGDISNDLRGKDTAPVYSFGGAIGVLLYGMMAVDEVEDAVEDRV